MLNQNLLLGDDGYLIQRSLRFRSSASAYLSRTPSSATNRTTWTWAGWVKRGSLGIYGQLFSARNTDPNNFGLLFYNDDTLYVADQTSTYNLQFKTTQVFRDPSAWYHIVLSIDTTQATNTNRVKLYVNGTQISSFSTATYPTQNLNTYVNTTNTHNIGAFTGGSNHFDGYLTETHFIDGQALTPSSFGETDPLTGVWKPKKYSGTYGTNGFYLNFSDNSAATAAAIGKDYSGNSNNWTPNNISVTAGTTYDSMTDVPTLTSATAANYPTWNPLSGINQGLSNANLLTVPTSASYFASATVAIPSTGKWYAEFTAQNSVNHIIGLSINKTSNVSNLGSSTGEIGYYWNGQCLKEGVSQSGTWASTTTNDVIGMAVDAGAQTVTFYKNGVATGSTVSYSGLGEMFFAAGTYFAGGYIAANFGQRPFSYTPPTGFLALNTFNLPDSTIKAGNKHFDATTYTGNGGTLSVTNAGGFQPDLVWIKSRSNATSHNWFDSVRGVNVAIFSDSTQAETTTNSLTSFNSNGFSASYNATYTGTNTNSATYAAWQWKAGGTGVSNTAGTITSTVSANVSAGFSVVTFTAPASGNFTVGHGLGVAPSMFILKTRSGVDSWYVYNKNFATPTTNYLQLNSTAAVASSASLWGSTNPTSSVLTLGTGGGIAANATGLIYAFSEVAGYSKFGSYVGNGSADGTFVYLGFRPRFVMIKQTSGAGQGWLIEDTARDSYNASGLDIAANSSGAEANDTPVMDILSNGFKMRNTYGGFNASGATYIYMAFAETPTKYALGR